MFCYAADHIFFHFNIVLIVSVSFLHIVLKYLQNSIESLQINDFRIGKAQENSILFNVNIRNCSRVAGCVEKLWVVIGIAGGK